MFISWRGLRGAYPDRAGDLLRCWPAALGLSDVLFDIVFFVVLLIQHVAGTARPFDRLTSRALRPAPALPRRSPDRSPTPFRVAEIGFYLTRSLDCHRLAWRVTAHEPTASRTQPSLMQYFLDIEPSRRPLELDCKHTARQRLGVMVRARGSTARRSGGVAACGRSGYRRVRRAGPPSPATPLERAPLWPGRDARIPGGGNRLRWDMRPEILFLALRSGRPRSGASEGGSLRCSSGWAGPRARDLVFLAAAGPRPSAAHVGAGPDRGRGPDSDRHDRGSRQALAAWACRGVSARARRHGRGDPDLLQDVRAAVAGTPSGSGQSASSAAGSSATGWG